MKIQVYITIIILQHAYSIYVFLIDGFFFSKIPDILFTTCVTVEIVDCSLSL